MDCQLRELPIAGEELSPSDRLQDRAHRGLHYLLRNARRVVAEPTVLIDKARLLRRPPPPPSEARVPVRPPPLGLQAGERVRVKSLEDIRATLDENGRCEGLAFMSIQGRFCGGEYTVHKRIERFFDERTRRMLKVKNMVILDDVYCEPPREGYQDYAGCDRTCFMFWKEAWLERA
jgi:hypothetical protein